MVVIVAACLVALAGCDNVTPSSPDGRPGDSGLGNPGESEEVGEGKGIPVDVGPQNFTPGQPIEDVVDQLEDQINDGCRAVRLANGCVTVVTQKDDKADTPPCRPSPDDPKTGSFNAYVHLDRELPSGGIGPKATENAGGHVTVFMKRCKPEGSSAESTPPTTTKTTTTKSTSKTTAPAPTTTTRPGG